MTQENNQLHVGVLHSITASMLFALVPAYLQWLPTIHGYGLVGQRIIWTTIFIGLLLMISGHLRLALKPLYKLKNWPGLLAGAALIGVQWSIFIWAPLQGETLAVALGYFLVPLVLVVIGRLAFSDRLSPAQWLAAGLAAIGVLISLFTPAQFSWIVLVIVIGYPLYFLLRRAQPMPVVSAFFIENLLLLPLAWWAIVTFTEAKIPFDYPVDSLLWFAGLGVLGSLSVLAMMSASRKLPLALFGLASYLEPPLIILVATLFIGEQIHPGEELTYLFIGLAVGILALDGVIKIKNNKRRQQVFR